MGITEEADTTEEAGITEEGDITEDVDTTERAGITEEADITEDVGITEGTGEAAGGGLLHGHTTGELGVTPPMRITAIIPVHMSFTGLS